MRRIRFFAWVVLLLAAGCRTVPVAPPVDWAAEKLARQQLQSWELAGRAAVATAADGWSASIRWQQQGSASELNLSGALGVGGVRVRSDGDAFSIDTSKGEHIEAQDASAALERELGVQLPVKNLRYWLLGVPAPGSTATESLDEAGRLARIEQDGWVGTFDKYESQEGRWLPARVQLTQGTTRVRVVINQWRVD